MTTDSILLQFQLNFVQLGQFWEKLEWVWESVSLGIHKGVVYTENLRDTKASITFWLMPYFAIIIDKVTNCKECYQGSQ